ncbi:MAG TPA: glycosyltransferase family 4 protein [Gemmatimonadaceae bacterium]
MRILLVNDGVGDAGGVQTYLSAVARRLRGRGHELALLHLDRLRAQADSPAGATAPHFCVDDAGVSGAVRAAAAWRPDVAFSNNMRALSVDARLMQHMPVVKMVHGYVGTCIGGFKMHAFPRPVACDRKFGMACVALYLPRHCCQWSVRALATQYRWARAQHALLTRYAAIVAPSEHMEREYVRHGVPASRVVANPLFAAEMPVRPAPLPGDFRVLFIGRMTSLKGGDVLIRAAAQAAAELGVDIPLTLAGDGPAREDWQALAESLGVRAEFPGWVSGVRRVELFRAASVVAVPSVWPEPFGLTGLEAGAYGAAAIGFNVGGIASWLHDGENGWLVNANEGAGGLARALVEARAHDATLRALRVGARRVAERLSLSRHADVLERVLAAARTPGGR